MNAYEVLPTEAERSMLSAMIHNVEAIWAVAEVLPLTQLLAPKHEIIAAALQRMAEEGVSIDVITLGDRLTRAGEINRVGGVGYLHELNDAATPWQSASYYAEIVRTEVETRRLAAAAQEILQLAGDPTVTPQMRAEKSRSLVDDALDIRVTANVDPLEAIREAAGMIGRVPIGLRTPWRSLTDLLGGLGSGSLYTIGARPRVGKTVAGLQMAEQMLEAGDVLYVSLEMTRRELVYRMIASNTEIDLRWMSKLTTPLPEMLQERVDAYLAGLERRPGQLHIMDKGGYTISEISHELRTLTRRKPVVAVVVDHIHLMRAEHTAAGANRVQELTEISGGLKRLGKLFGIPVIALAQLNRNIDNRGDRTPTLADLRDSGSIEQDSDVVIILDRDTTNDQFGDPLDPAMYFNVVKNRQGPSAQLTLVFDGPFVRIIDPTQHH